MSLGVKVPGGHGGGDHVPGEGEQLVKVASGWPGPRLCLGPARKGGLTKASLSQAPHTSVPAALRAPGFSGGLLRADALVTVVPSIPPPGVTVSLQEELPWRVFKERGVVLGGGAVWLSGGLHACIRVLGLPLYRLSPLTPLPGLSRSCLPSHFLRPRPSAPLGWAALPWLFHPP